MDLNVMVSGDIVNDENKDVREVIFADASFLMNAQNSNLFSPRQVTLGVAYEGARWNLALDFVWMQWSRFEAPTATLTFDLDLGGLPFEMPEQPNPTAPGFDEIVVVRAGGEFQVIDSAWGHIDTRLGYALEPSPVPPQRGRTNYVDGLKHVFSVGLGVTLSSLSPVMTEGLRFDVSFQAGWLPRINVVKDNPADLVGGYTADGLTLGGALTTSLLF